MRIAALITSIVLSMFGCGESGHQYSFTREENFSGLRNEDERNQVLSLANSIIIWPENRTFARDDGVSSAIEVFATRNAQLLFDQKVRERLEGESFDSLKGLKARTYGDLLERLRERGIFVSVLIKPAGESFVVWLFEKGSDGQGGVKVR